MIAIGYLCAFLVGIVLGLLGGGGSILGVPILVYLFATPASLATVYSLFLVGVSSLTGTISYARKGLLDLRTGLFFLLPSMIGVTVSRRLILPAIPDLLFQGRFFSMTKDRLILIVFAAVMGLAAYSMLRQSKIPKSIRSGLSRIPIYGLMAGLLMGFVGAGGGFLIVPVLVNFGKMDMKPAIGTSLLIITVSSLSGFGGDWLAGISIDWPFLIRFSALSIAGVFLGTRLGNHVSSSKLKRAFGILILAVAGLILAKELLFTR